MARKDLGVAPSANASLIRKSDLDADVAALVTPVGSIAMWPTNTPPTGWLIMDGTTFSAATYPALNTLLGGNTLPDARVKYPIGKAAAGTGSTLLGTGGDIWHQHSVSAHTHTTVAHVHSVDPPNYTMPASASVTTRLASTATLAGSTHTHTVDIAAFNSSSSGGGTTSSDGSGLTTSENPPFLGVHFIIRAAP